MAINKNEIYKQIDAFNNSPAVAGGRAIKSEQFYYVTKEIGEDRAAFLKYILSNDVTFKSKKIKNISVLDLAFGSGNLSSHLILDNDIGFSKIIFNDKHFDRVNSKIVELFEKKAILKKDDFFKSEKFNDVKDIDFVVFNPQVGGTGDDFKIKAGTVPVISSLTIKNYIKETFKTDDFETKDLNITVDENKKNITIASEEYTRAKLVDTIGIEIINYYDVNYKGKTGDATTNATDIVKFRKTFDSVFNKNGILAYYGDEANFKILFADFNYSLNYWASPKNLILASLEKGKEKTMKCFEKEGSKFVEIPNCEKVKNNANSDGNLDKLEDEISEELVKLKLSNDNESPITKTNTPVETPSIMPCEDISAFIEDKPRNKIYYGAPGTGKSFKLRDTVLNELHFPESNIKRVTFHPSYSYQQFVGSYKPTPIYKAIDDSVFGLYESNKVNQLTSPHNKEPLIDYSFVPGPFLELLIAALLAEKNNSKCNFMLIIEEINRANVASVFGDVFQLLDRNDDGSSEYHITFNTDIRNYLISKGIDEEEIKLPSNFFIWATMNNADQGVMPLDSAFKRRWTFEYIGINDAEKELNGRPIKFQNKCLEWNSFRKKINSTLKGKVNEDKLLGPFFMNKAELLSSESVKSKLLLYLREDVLRHNPEYLFLKDLETFSEISAAYDEKPLREIFANFDWGGITISDKCPIVDKLNVEIEELDSEGFVKENINEKKGKERPQKTIDEHFSGTTAEFRNIFNELKEKIEQFGSDVISRTTFGEIIFEDKSSFAKIYVSKNKDRLRVLLRTIDDQIDDPKHLTEAIPKTHEYGNLTRKFNINGADLNILYNLDDVLLLLKQAYESKK